MQVTLRNFSYCLESSLERECPQMTSYPGQGGPGPTRGRAGQPGARLHLSVVTAWPSSLTDGVLPGALPSLLAGVASCTSTRAAGSTTSACRSGSSCSV